MWKITNSNRNTVKALLIVTVSNTWRNCAPLGRKPLNNKKG